MNGDSQIVEELPKIFDEIRDDVVKVVGAGVVCYLTYKVFRYVYIRRYVGAIRQENKEILEKQTENIEKLIQESGLSDQELEDIVQLDWDDLVSRLQAGSLSSTAVLRAYQHAAVQVNTKTNSIVRYLQCAEDTVKKLDQLRPEERGPFHGIPFSIKECYNVKNTPSTAGCVMFSRIMDKEDCPLVTMIKSLGGVPFCKTNVPQQMMSLQCSNPIYGTTCNPHSRDDDPRECGGSSGGEGALIGGEKI